MLVNHSEIFRDMFMLPPSPSTDALIRPEGSSDDTPIVLPDDPEEFACVLKVLYDGM